MNNVFLTGFMGTGKTAVGRALADRLGRPFVDLDEEIERSAGMRASEIFARFGEADFRARERHALEAASARERVVVATGGGIVIDPRNRRAMRSSGSIVCLWADDATILRRVGDADERPMLAGAKDPAERVRELLAARGAAYADADHAVDTSSRDVAGVADAIALWLTSAEAAAIGPRVG